MDAKLAAENAGVKTGNTIGFSGFGHTLDEAVANVKSITPINDGAFTATLEMIPAKQPKRKYYVGLNNKLGRLRYWYYKKRGWIWQDIYFARPQQSTLAEWLHCLVSPSHARGSWLRVDDETEQRMLRRMNYVVIALFAAVLFVAGIIVGEVRTVHFYQNQPQQPIHLQLNSMERVD